MPRGNGHGLWKIDKLRIAGSADGELHHFVVGFGQDAVGEVYVVVKDTAGTSGHIGKIYKLVAPSSS